MRRFPDGQSLPLVQWHAGSFPWRANPGSSYDTWSWVYPAQTSQYLLYANAWHGNQLPNFSVRVPKISDPAVTINRPWWTQKNIQLQNNFLTAGSGQTPLVWPQQDAADYISSLGNAFAKNKGGGPVRGQPRYR